MTDSGLLMMNKGAAMTGKGTFAKAPGKVRLTVIGTKASGPNDYF